MKIQALYLSILLRNKSFFKSFNVPIKVLLDLKYPFTTNGLLSSGNVSIVQVLVSSSALISLAMVFLHQTSLKAWEYVVGLTSLSRDARNALWELDNHAKLIWFRRGWTVPEELMMQGEG